MELPHWGTPGARPAAGRGWAGASPRRPRGWGPPQRRRRRASGGKGPVTTRQPTDKGRPVTQPKEAAKAPTLTSGRGAHQGRPGAARQGRAHGRGSRRTTRKAAGSGSSKHGCQTLQQCERLLLRTLRGVEEAENSASLCDGRQFTESRCGGWQLPQRRQARVKEAVEERTADRNFTPSGVRQVPTDLVLPYCRAGAAVREAEGLVHAG